LPNNLFTDHAGTEVGSDLIILQKNTAKTSLTPNEQAFIESRTLSNGEQVNNCFQDFQRVVHTKAYTDTNLYGKPAMVFIHEGGVPGIASDLKKMLNDDFSKNLNHPLYYHQSEVPISTLTAEQLETRAAFEALIHGHARIPIFAERKESEQKEQAAVPTPTPQSTPQPTPKVEQPLITLYDLFGISEEERKQRDNRQKKGKGKQKQSIPRQLDLFAQPTTPAPAKPVIPIAKPAETPIEPRTFSGTLEEFHKQASLVVDNGQVGFLKERHREDAVFMPLVLNITQQTRAEHYIKFRDEYQHLYAFEATQLKENKGLRASMNELYDDFVKRYGNLNDRKNLDLIKMDAGGQEILSLERSIDGKFVKADIFNQPVSFNPNETTHVNSSEEALSASLNKFGEVNTGYMLSLLDEKSIEELLQDLHGASITIRSLSIMKYRKNSFPATSLKKRKQLNVTLKTIRKAKTGFLFQNHSKSCRKPRRAR
jgi:hypothetical protein